MGRIIADRIEGELDVVLVRKIPAAPDPELAVGAVDEHGTVALASYFHRSRTSMEWVEAQVRDQVALMQRRRAAYGPSAEVRGRIAIVVDDGLATGSTMRAAVAAVRAGSPARVVVAVPVGARETCAQLADEADEVVCATMPASFVAVGQWYDDFTQTTDDEIRVLLDRREDEHAH
jgi:predicted phosphoribosyltransferase